VRYEALLGIWEYGLILLDKVTEEERRDSEIFYLNWISRNTKPSDRISLHPRWEKLVDCG
jgi:hypothetical protein